MSDRVSFVYVVERDSADGPEVDIFTDYELATAWAKHIGARVREEPVIDRTGLHAMMRTCEPLHTLCTCGHIEVCHSCEVANSRCGVCGCTCRNFRKE